MPSVSNCPACKEKITIPDGVADDAALRCPLCQAQFSLSDVVLTATAAPPAAVLVDTTFECAANDVEPEATESADATDEPAGNEDTVEESITAAEPEDSLAAEVESIRSKTEAFQGSADPAADDPSNLQVQADELALEAQALLAKVGQSTYEAKEAEAKAMALVTRAMGYRKSTGNALGTLADALDAVARSVEEKCETLTAELGEEPATLDNEQAEQSVADDEAPPSDSTEDAPNPFAFLQSPERDRDEEGIATHEEEPPVEEPEEAPAAEEPENPFAFLSEERSSEEQAETAVEEEGLVVDDSQPAVEEAEPAVKETDMFSFLAQVDQAAGEKADVAIGEQELTLEEPESMVADESAASVAAEDSAESKALADVSEVAEAEDKADPLELAAELPVETQAEETADAESLRIRLEALRAVANALRARAAELREEARSLLDASTEYAIQGEAGEGWGNTSWQPDSASAAVGGGAFSFEGGATSAGTSGRAARPGRRKKETSFFKELIGIVLGGAGGLLIAYYGLNFFGGKRFDFAKIYLPGIQHTVKHRPAWWPTWARFEGSEETLEGTGEEPVWEEATVAQPPAPAPVERKTKAAKKPKSSKPSKAAPELPTEPAFAAPPELPSQPDLMAPPELGPTPDLTPSPELTVSPDLAAPSEMSVSPDLPASSEMNISPDLATPSSVTLSPELMGTPQPKPSQPAVTNEEVRPDAVQAETVAPEKTQAKPVAPKQEEMKSAPARDEEATPAPAKETSQASESKPSATPVGYVDLKKRPKYAPQDLADAINGFPEVFGCPKCNSTGQVNDTVCPDCQGHPSVAYSEFCRLGEVLAFVDASQGEQLDAHKTEVRALLEKAGSKPELVKEIGGQAVGRLDDDSRSSPGILFAGTVVDTGAKGKLQAATVKLAGVERTIKLISPEPIDLAVKDRVMVLGCLVKNGSANHSDAAAPLFVWRGMVVKFSK